MSDNESDAVLVARLAAGDPAALAALYDRHADAIYRVAFRRLGDRQHAEEVLQDTYLALWNRAELFDPSMGSLIGWLSTIARNRASDRRRALLRRSALPPGLMWSADDADPEGQERVIAGGTPLASGSAGPSDDPQRAADQAEQREQIRAALTDLPDVEREVLRLAYYEELTQSEIALRLGWPIGTVKTRTRRALLRLRAALALEDRPGRDPAAIIRGALPAKEAGAIDGAS
jgi:RNA polymerase sigma-70 factor, ECF subfamily